MKHSKRHSTKKPFKKSPMRMFESEFASEIKARVDGTAIFNANEDSGIFQSVKQIGVVECAQKHRFLIGIMRRF